MNLTGHLCPNSICQPSQADWCNPKPFKGVKSCAPSRPFQSSAETETNTQTHTIEQPTHCALASCCWLVLCPVTSQRAVSGPLPVSPAQQSWQPHACALSRCMSNHLGSQFLCSDMQQSQQGHRLIPHLLRHSFMKGVQRYTQGFVSQRARHPRVCFTKNPQVGNPPCQSPVQRVPLPDARAAGLCRLGGHLSQMHVKFRRKDSALVTNSW